MSKPGDADLVLVPGTGAGAEALEPLAAALGGARVFHRSGWDGGSVLPRQGYFGAHAARLIAEAAAPVALFGWSSGGFIALHAALLDASRVRRLFLYEPPLFSRGDDDAGSRNRFLAMLGWRAVGMKARARAAFWRMVSPRSDGGTGFDRLEPGARAALVSRDGPLLRELFAGTGEELAGRLASLGERTTVLVGGASASPARRAAERAVGELPGSRLVVVDGADHLAPISMPGELARAVNACRAAG